MASTITAPTDGASLRVRVQKFGTFLSSMIMPNIGAIVGWGLITAFFIPVGWIPNEKIATIVGPGIFYLLPILIAYTGGKIVHGVRGGVVGALGVMGVILATQDELFIGPDGNAAPMFLGAMIMGPVTALVMKWFDGLWSGKIRPGFEMLVDNFSAGIVGAAMSILGMFLLAPVLRWVTTLLGNLVETLVDNGLLPLTSILIEPAKVLFLNNAINHGVLTPLGLQQVQEDGKSVLFLLEANPGPGLGLLLAYMFLGKGLARASAPGAAIIHFFGGIHEVYFPYVLMKPRMLLAMIAGGMTGVFLNVVFGVGLVAPAAPGSIFAVYAQTARGSFVGVTIAVLGAAAVTFLVASFLLRTDRSEGEGDLSSATASMEQMKGKKSVASSVLGGAGTAHTGPINSIVFACDAGMGSSAMGASVLRRKIQAAGHHDVTVVNRAIANLKDEFDVVVSHQDLTARARERTGSAIHFSVDNFMGSPRYDEIVELISTANAAVPASVGASAVAGGAASGGAATLVSEPEVDTATLLAPSSIVLTGRATSRDDAISEAGRLLVEAGAVTGDYVDSMHERERSVSTHMGSGLAIPHGTNEAKGSILRTAICFVRYPDGIDWNGNPTEFVIGIAGAGDDHLAVLSKVARVFADSAQVQRLRDARSRDDVLAVLDGVRA